MQVSITNSPGTDARIFPAIPVDVTESTLIF